MSIPNKKPIKNSDNNFVKIGCYKTCFCVQDLVKDKINRGAGKEADAHEKTDFSDSVFRQLSVTLRNKYTSYLQPNILDCSKKSIPFKTLSLFYVFN